MASVPMEVTARARIPRRAKFWLVVCRLFQRARLYRVSGWALDRAIALVRVEVEV